MAVERDRRRDRTGRRAAARQQSQPHEAERRTKENDKIRRVTSARARSVEKEFLAYSAPPSRDKIFSRLRRSWSSTNPSAVVVLSWRLSQRSSRRADGRSSFRGPPWLPGRRACTGDNRNCCQAAACAEAAPPRVRSGEGARAPAPNLDLMAVRAQITIGPNAPRRARETSSSSLGQRTSHKAVKEGGAARSMCARAAGVCASGGRPQGCMRVARKKKWDEFRAIS